MGWMEKLRIAPRWSRDGGRARLEPLERLALGPQHALHVVRFGDEEILVGRSPSGLTVLGRRREPQPPQEAGRWEGV